MRFNYLTAERFPDTPEQDYPKRLDRALREWYRNFRRAVKELDSPPALMVARTGSNQSLVANTLTLVQFNSTVVDTHGWWDAATYLYTPQEPGFYRCSWAINFRDSGAVATSTYAYAQLDTATPYRVIGYGNGAGQDIHVSGSAVVECDGSATTLSVKGLMLAGSAPSVFQETAYRSWFSVDYIGRRSL